MVSKFFRSAKNMRGQAMAEFALTIPVFLLLVFGIIELSRFFLVYSSVFTAVREATRYGSSIGDEGNPNYHDCSEIAEVAVRAGNFGGVQKDLVKISFEAIAPESDDGRVPIAFCPNNDPGTVPLVIDCENECEYTPSLGDRIYIEIATDYKTLLGIVPNLTIDASNGRTIMLGLKGELAEINTVTPGGPPTATSGATATKSPTATPSKTPTTTSTSGGQNPTNIPSSTPKTPEPIDPNDFCPSPSVDFEGNFYTSNKNDYTWVIKIKNNSEVEFDLESITSLVWTTGNGAVLKGVDWDGTKIWPTGSQTSSSPFSFSWPVDSRPSIIGKTGNGGPVLLEIGFTFDKKTDKVSISSLNLNFVKSDDETCKKPLPLTIKP